MAGRVSAFEHALHFDLGIRADHGRAVVPGHHHRAAAMRNDFAAVMETANASEMAAEAETPGSLFRKIPREMKYRGFDTRKKFDGIAADAQESEDNRHIVKRLSVALGRPDP